MKTIAALVCLTWPTVAGAVDMTAFQAAIACSDQKLQVYAKTTQEPIDTIVLASTEDCKAAWLKAAAAQAERAKDETFVEDYIDAIGQYFAYASPKALAWRRDK